MSKVEPKMCIHDTPLEEFCIHCMADRTTLRAYQEAFSACNYVRSNIFDDVGDDAEWAVQRCMDEITDLISELQATYNRRGLKITPTKVEPL